MTRYGIKHYEGGWSWHMDLDEPICGKNVPKDSLTINKKEVTCGSCILILQKEDTKKEPTP